MKNIFLIITIVSHTFISCTSNKKDDKNKDSISIDSSELDKNNALDTNALIKSDTTKTSVNNLPIYGELTKETLAQYYPNITDTIKHKYNFMAHKLDLNPGNGILVGMLFNSAVSSQMFLCTHDSKLNLIDQLYIGEATDFDGGTSHTITQKIISKTEITFDQIDWGDVKDKNNDIDIDTIGHQKWNVFIDKNGLIQNKIFVYKKEPLN